MLANPFSPNDFINSGESEIANDAEFPESHGDPSPDGAPDQPSNGAPPGPDRCPNPGLKFTITAKDRRGSEPYLFGIASVCAFRRTLGLGEDRNSLTDTRASYRPFDGYLSAGGDFPVKTPPRSAIDTITRR
jgi:hypothetical protein